MRVSAGEFRAPQVVVAIGYEHSPFIPDWDGRESFGAACCTRPNTETPSRSRDKSVLVVGPGCSGMEIAYDLAEGGASKVWLSARTPPNIVMREGPAGLPGDVIARRPVPRSHPASPTRSRTSDGAWTSGT